MQIRVGRYSILLLLPFFVSVCASAPRGVVVFCAGDSITAGGYPHFLQRLFNGEGLRARVLNYGRSGFTSGQYLDFLERNTDRLKAERPDFVLIQLGTSDVRVDADHTPTDVYRSQMMKIIAVFRGFRSRSGKAPGILLATIPSVPKETPFPFAPESAERISAEINPVVRSIAAKENLPLVDNFGLFLDRPDLLPDVHPSNDGYRVLAGNWFSALKLLIRP